MLVFAFSLSPRGCSLVSLAHSSRFTLYVLYSRRDSFFLFDVFASILLRSFVLLLRFLIDSLLDSLCSVLCDLFFFFSFLLSGPVLRRGVISTPYVAYRQPPIDLLYTNNASAVSGQRLKDMAPNTQPPNIFEDAPRSPTKPSVIRAILSAKAHKRNLSADETIAPKPLNRSKPLNNSFESSIDGQNQHYQQPLTEITANRDAGDGPPKSPTKSGGIGLHKKTKSAVSLKSLISYMERKDNKTEDLADEESQEWKPKKAKSANSLTAILKRSQRGRKNSTASSKDGPNNKENRSPSDSLPSPVWTQYTARSSFEQPAPRRSQDKRRTLHDEVSLYTPRGYGPQEQRNFYDLHQPSLTKHTETRPRPKSEIITGNRKMKEVLGAMRTPSDNAYPADAPESPSPTKPQGRPRRFSRPRSRSRSRQELSSSQNRSQSPIPKRFPASKQRSQLSMPKSREQICIE